MGNGNLLCYSIPNSINAVSIIKSLKDAITANHYEVKVVLDLEALDIWVTDDHVWVSSVARPLGFDVSKSFGDRKTARKDSQRALDVQVLFTWGSSSLCESLGSVNFTTSCLDSDFLKLIIWLVIS